MVVNERTVFPTFLEEGKTLIVSGGPVFDLYKHGSRLISSPGLHSGPLPLSEAVKAYSAESK